MKITLCTCQFYQRTPCEKITAVLAVCCRNVDVSCVIVPDLCFVAANDRNALERIASCDVVLACQTRAVRAMLGDAGHARCIDLRTESLADIFTALSLTPVDVPASEPVYDKLDSNWTPWFPVIDAGRCVHCRKCVDFCMFGVYAVEAEKVCVIKPESCKTDCPACARICPQNAIIFPKSDDERLNGSLAEPVKPSDSDNTSLRERLKHRKGLRLFKEDTP